MRGARTPTVRNIVDDLRKAKVDRAHQRGAAQSDRFLDAVLGQGAGDPRRADRFPHVQKTGLRLSRVGGDRDYYLASAADKVFLMPSSTLDLTGVATYEVFLRGLLDKVGVYPDLHHIGEYKTFSNTFTEKGFTPAHREMDASMNRDLYDQIVRTVAGARRKTEPDVRQLIDQAPFLHRRRKRPASSTTSPTKIRSMGKLREARPGATRTIEGDDYARVALSSLGLNKGPRIAVIYLAGAIASGKNGYDPLEGATIGSDTLIESIRKVRKDSSVRAIVLRIDSPGGSAAASDAIWRELMLAKKERADRPIIASMSDLGGLRRLLHRRAGRSDRRAAVDPHRVDWHRRRQVRHRRHLREAGRQPRLGEHRQTGRDELADSALQPG